jgi:dolichol-phosphate mannosyltransferase
MLEKLVVIVLPMYNEELSIPLLRKMFDGDFPLPPSYDYRIVAVNDGSQDGTLQLANNWARENPRLVVLSHTQNMGVGQAILTGFCEAIRMGSHCVATLDADASHPGNIIRQMVEKSDLGADIVIASRFTAGGKQVGVPPLRQLYSLGARILLSLFFPLKGVKDYTVGFRAYKTSVLYQALSQSEESFLKFRSFASSVEILLKVATVANKIEEVPLVLRYDHKVSPSKLKLWLTIRDYLKLFLLPQKSCPLGRGLVIS